jgi:hypothetical protein
MVGSSPSLGCELVSTEQTTTMNIVATLILAIKGIAVNKDFGKGHLADLSESVGTFKPNHHQSDLAKLCWTSVC